MNLMGEYAAANHAVIHRSVARAPEARGARGRREPPQLRVEGKHDGKEVIVHRKGATPAGAGVLGVIPGSMATPGFVVRGKGSAGSLDSASPRRRPAHEPHGGHARSSAGTTSSPMLEERGVQLLSAGIDENPFAYKDIHDGDGRAVGPGRRRRPFDPKIVRMADAGEQPED